MVRNDCIREPYRKGSNEPGEGLLRELKVLVVEDDPAFSELISTIVQQDSRLRIVGVASDGIAAVSAAVELQPDLVLSDIGLPKQNGLQAARQILDLVPQSKIVFVTGESSPELVWHAIDLGASGYVSKLDVMAELLAAVSAVREGDKYVSAGCSGARVPSVSGGSVHLTAELANTH